ncbi:bifunctional transcriptional activator/DNA repair enzyme protein Ada [Loktanella sp. D2R18]|uniref:bifunctional transcriptional activator/DNA repair enzyme AdaA n=1 Tax=Rhodobacterales TaxID=204455 RepID=UPI000DE86FE0|nr:MULTISPECIES: trifunctional transcriptional activator/DNA repair protein Ada/methylated-DNA--[protein]-cysteine S-methyltransferase [Rhodobacterales]MDO6590673.1 trifunctional transcriptional activator/DNA repair protein Ada/methylated-DNA--[protein]-cysteine S-methyltransferase [Yoonia sp. 1_MG-2023]RBW44702.1 bifunctional transcriptional activator/DNA repair enzyme protein Ada [Loktanella sp. D2R18]
MLMTLPNDDVLYEALLARDPAYDGTAFVGVSSTGIFCRLTCPARKPKRENCNFFSDVSDCIQAGFRPCKRCHPVAPAAQTDPAITALLAALDADPMRRWSEADVTAMGFDPSTVRRSFKRHFGMTFLDMARQRRLASGFTALETGKVIDAQLDAGFDSPAAFRAAFAKLIGTAPGNFANDALLRAAHIPTPLGDMIAVCDKRALHLLEFADRKALPAELARLRKMSRGDIGIGRTDITEQTAAELTAFFDGTSADFTVPLVLHGTPFTRQVWTALRDIPAGETRSYGALAQTINAPTATRAVARANGSNQIALIIPCHRVIGADGSLTGYGGGLWRKQKLIDLEKTYAQRTIK